MILYHFIYVCAFLYKGLRSVLWAWVIGPVHPTQVLRPKPVYACNHSSKISNWMREFQVWMKILTMPCRNLDSPGRRAATWWLSCWACSDCGWWAFARLRYRLSPSVSSSRGSSLLPRSQTALPVDLPLFYPSLSNRFSNWWAAQIESSNLQVSESGPLQSGRAHLFPNAKRSDEMKLQIFQLTSSRTFPLLFYSIYTFNIIIVIGAKQRLIR